MRQKITMLMHRAALDRDIRPERRKRLLETWGPIDDHEFGRLQTTLDEIIEKRPPGRLALAAHVLHREKYFLGRPCLTPSATSKEIDVAFLSSFTRTTVPSRISRTMGSSTSEGAFQASQSPFSLAPDTADDILADPSGEEAGEHPLDPAVYWCPTNRPK